MNLIVLALAAAPLWAAPPARPLTRCPREGKPSFTGQPFRPVRCPGMPEPGRTPDGKALPDPEPPRLASDAPRPTLQSLAGRWTGVLPVGMDRHDLFWEVRRRGKSDSWDIRFETRNVRMLDHKIFRAALKPKGRGEYGGPVSFQSLPDYPLQAVVYAGTPPAPRPGADAYDQEFLIRYPGLPGGHRLRVAAMGKDKLRFLYWDMTQPDAEPCAGELVRCAQTSL